MNEIIAMYDSDATIGSSSKTTPRTPTSNKSFQINNENNQLYDYIDDNINFIDYYMNINDEIDVNTVGETNDIENYVYEVNHMGEANDINEIPECK